MSLFFLFLFFNFYSIQASRIVLATDGDLPGQVLAEELARRLGKERFVPSYSYVHFVLLYSVSQNVVYFLKWMISPRTFFKLLNIVQAEKSKLQ